jgi:hypothetical protein
MSPKMTSNRRSVRPVFLHNDYLECGERGAGGVGQVGGQGVEAVEAGCSGDRVGVACPGDGGFAALGCGGDVQQSLMLRPRVVATLVSTCVRVL